MAYQYFKALHIIFVVTWFAGMFYMPRLFIYNTEASEKEEPIRTALHQQFSVMMKRLWFGITWPSAILTLILGLIVLFKGGWNNILFSEQARWLLVKLLFVLLLYVYHFSLHKIYKQQINGLFKFTSQQLRIWNEMATIFLVSIVMLATVKESISFVWGFVGLACFILLLMSAVKIYKFIRKKNKS